MDGHIMDMVVVEVIMIKPSVYQLSKLRAGIFIGLFLTAYGAFRAIDTIVTFFDVPIEISDIDLGGW